jgi:formylglycine-generating enzyme required for sulfatase activity
MTDRFTYRDIPLSKRSVMADRQLQPAKVPVELAEAAGSGEIVPVIGDWLNSGRPQGLPTPDQLAETLGRRLEADAHATFASGDLPMLASRYEAIKGEHALVSWIRHELGDATPEISPELRLAVGLTTEAIITTSVSLAGEAALNSVGMDAFSVLSDPLKASYTSKDRRPWLIKLAGCVTNPESLVVSRDRIIWMSTAMDHIAILVKGILLTRALVFIGYHLSDPHLEMVHSLLQTETKHSRRRYIIIDSNDPSADELAPIWEHRGYELLCGPMQELLRVISLNIHPIGRSLRKAETQASVSPKPFKFLDYFTEGDTDVFFGRDDETEFLTSMVATSRFTLIVGASGVGKTSLVNAGLIPRLHARGFDTYSVRALQHPVTEILAEVVPESKLAPAGTDLYAELEQALSDRPTVVIIDQFEEFFIRIGPESRAEFAQQLHRCITSDFLNLHVVAVIREDFLHFLLEMEPPIEQVFKNRYWVRVFTRQQLTDFLLATAQHFGVEFEDALAARLREDLDDNGIDPSHLQIVCHTLYSSTAGGAQRLRVSDYERLGGTAGILARYLDHALKDLGPQEEALARRVLKCMVSADQTKAAMSAKEIAKDALVMRLGHSKTALRGILQELTRRRVIRPLPGRDGVFELAHDIIARKIWAWIEPEEIELKYVRQVLQQCVIDWERLRVLPGRTQWTAIDRHRDDLMLEPREARLTLRAALTWNEHVDDWMRKAAEAGLDRWRELREVLHTDAPEARLALLSWLGGIQDARRVDLLRLSLDSEYPAIRRAAQRVVESNDLSLTESVSMGSPDDLFVPIEAGEFVFGTDDLRFEYSQPSFRVYVSAFALQQYPVTNFEYSQFVRETGYRPPDHWHGSAPPERLLEHPVTQVSWYDANAYCDWYREKFGLPVRLPTAAEWEKAAGWDAVKGEKRLWSWGNEYDPDKGNSRIGGPGHATPIGQYSPAGGDSPYGISDLCGNTFDWTQDWWVPRYDSSLTRDPQGPPEGQHKSARGGSWAGSAEGISAVSNKYSLAPETRNEYTGFRMAYSLPRTPDR